MGQPLIDLKNITKTFDGTVVLDDLNLSVKENTFVTLLGPSVCGKSSALSWGPCAGANCWKKPSAPPLF